MRTMLILIAMALLIIPVISQSTQISGNYGETWLAQSGNKNVVEQQSPNQGLWSWGAIPKGRSLSNGKLMPESPGILIYPAFPTSTTPIVINATTPSEAINGSNSSQISNPYISEDPWVIAQTADQPVFFRTLPY
jgi:hypothetical protein